MRTDRKPESPPGPLIFSFHLPTDRRLQIVKCKLFNFRQIYSVFVYKYLHSDSSIVFRMQAINNKIYIR
jgi:hypothetical protein